MSSQVRSAQQAIQIDVAPAGPTSVTVTTTADPIRDERLERFWETVHNLIFDERKTLSYKGEVLRRYARVLNRGGEAEMSDYATRLAGSYGEVIGAIAHW